MKGKKLENGKKTNEGLEESKKEGEEGKEGEVETQRCNLLLHFGEDSPKMIRVKGSD